MLKKFYLFIFLFLNSIAFSQSNSRFVINVPTATLSPKDTTVITWTGGSSTDVVELYLVDKKAWAVELVIAKNLPNTGSYTWVTEVGRFGEGTKLYSIQTPNQSNYAYSSEFGVHTPTVVCSAKTSNQSLTGCGSVVFKGKSYTSSQTVIDTLIGKASNGCDSIITTNITITASKGKFVINAPTSTLSPKDKTVITWTGGCPTDVVELYLVDKKAWAVELVIAKNLPNTGSYTWVTEVGRFGEGTKLYSIQTPDQSNYAYSSEFGVHTPTVACSAKTSNQSLTGCGSVVFKGKSYTSSQTVIDTLVGKASNGCDSIITFNLTINQGVSSNETATACGSFTWNGKTYTKSGDYIDTLKTSAGCDSIVTLNVTINPIPVVAEIVGEKHTQVDATSLLTVATPSGIWFSSDSTIAYVNGNGAVKGLKEGTVTIRYELNSNGCSNNQTIPFVVTSKKDTSTTGMDEKEIISWMHVYPNPFTNKLYVKTAKVSTYAVELIDVTGKVLSSYTFENTNELELDLRHIANGEYLLKVMNDQMTQTRKLTK